MVTEERSCGSEEEEVVCTSIGQALSIETQVNSFIGRLPFVTVAELM